MTSLFIVEDHVLLSEGLKSLIEKNFINCIIRVFNSGIDLLENITETDPPKIVILDLNIPGKNGLEILQELRKRKVNTKVIIYTMYNDSKLVNSCKEKGACAYLLKNNSYEELLSLINNIGEQEFYLGENVKTEQTDIFFKDGFEISLNLTSREKEVIGLLADDLTSAEIASRLSISQYTVDTHRKNLMKKLKVKSVAGVIRFASDNNLI